MRKVPGMGGNMQNLMKQAQKMQKEMQRVQEEIEKRTVEASVGGNAVKVIATGKKEIVEIIIDKAVVDPDDVEMLQDLVLSGVNEALRNAEKMMSEEMGKITGGINVPGLF